MIPKYSPSSDTSEKMRANFYFMPVFALAIYFFGKLLWPFWSILVLAFLLTNLFRPIFIFLVRYMSDNFASFLTCILIVAIVFVPLLFFVFSLTDEAFNLLNWAKDSRAGLRLQTWLQQSSIVHRILDQFKEIGFTFDPSQISEAFTYVVKQGGLFLYEQANGWAANVIQFLFYFFIMILVIFFLLIDQPKLIAYVVRLSPLPDKDNRLLIDKFQQIANAILKGNGICGLIQGILGGVVFYALELNSPLLWGSIMAILAFLPIFGIGLVMLPAVIFLAINGAKGTALFLFFYYIVLSFSVEYFIKPKMVGTEVKMHTLLVFLAIIGGLSVYGILGIIYGPLTITGFLTLSDMYLRRYGDYDNEGEQENNE